MNKRASGYSLIEVLVAIAITSVVLLTVLSLFYMGRRNVYGGKQMTQAVAVGTRIMEDIETMTVAQFRSNFALTDTTPLVNVTVKNVPGRGDIVYPSSIGLDSTSCTATAGIPPAPPAVTCSVDAPLTHFMANWYGTLLAGSSTNQSAVLANPTIGLVITPRTPRVVASPVVTAQFTRIRVYVSWDEAPGARRYAFFDTTKEQ
jgi:prepilin-type N-terminal cleavage/methylation domain-containing protein